MHPHDLDPDNEVADVDILEALTTEYVEGMRQILGDRWTVRETRSNDEASGVYIGGCHSVAPEIGVEVNGANEIFWHNLPPLDRGTAVALGGIDC